MTPRQIAILTAMAALAASSWGCAPAPEARALTAADKAQLLREHETLELRRRLGGASPQRLGCTASNSASRLMARANRFSGADSFDSRGCPEEPAGRGPAGEAPSE